MRQASLPGVPVSTPAPPLEARGVCAARGGKEVVHDISLRVRGGQWLAIVGPNGAGKSTLLRCLAGLMPPSRGEVLWQGKPILSLAARSRARALAWLGQGSEADDSMRVQDTVALGRLPHQGWWGAPAADREDARIIDQALNDTDMQWARERPLGALSGGERQRVHLARALAVQAPVLLLDEPVSHLDAPHQRLLAQVLAREAGMGRCVVSVLHELPLALMADRVAVMQDGCLVAEGARHDPALHRAMESVFDHAVAITEVSGRWTAIPDF